MKSKLILNDNSSIEIESASSLSDIRVLSKTKADMLSAWDMLTEGNLKSIQIQDAAGGIVGAYENLVLHDETSSIREDGTVLTSFHIREKTAVELLREEVSALKEGQEVQDGAISDLGEAVSSLAEEGGAV